MRRARGKGKTFLYCPDCKTKQVYRKWHDGDEFYRCRRCSFYCYATAGDPRYSEQTARDQDRLAAANP